MRAIVVSAAMGAAVSVLAVSGCTHGPTASRGRCCGGSCSLPPAGPPSYGGALLGSSSAGVRGYEQAQESMTRPAPLVEGSGSR